MWPFKKKYPPLSDLPREAAWEISQGTHDDRAMLVRVNASVDAFRGHPELNHQVGVAVPCKTPRPDGMPTEAETTALNTIEDRLFEVFEGDGNSVVVAIVTTNGMREFVMYTRDPRRAQECYERLKASVDSGHDIQLMIQPDPTWRAFTQFR